MTKSYTGIVAILIAVIALGVVVFRGYSPELPVGGQFNENNHKTFFQGLTIGTQGTSLSRVNKGICFLQPYAATIAATSTVAVECQGTAAIGTPTLTNTTALPGVKGGDEVFVQLSVASAGQTIAGLHVAGATASTTRDGYITLRVTNLTGTTFTWPITGTATGTASFITIR